MTLAQAEVGAKTNETVHFQPLLAPLGMADAVVTFDALHSVKANIAWLVETESTRYIAVIRTNQPTAHRQSATQPRQDIAVRHTRLARYYETIPARCGTVIRWAVIGIRVRRLTRADRRRGRARTRAYGPQPDKLVDSVE
ncbi:hypothetical protein ABZ835_33425 [Streptomyces sp. NPDC047461]|uniref:hypothetical protein n=1 Tax=Streptomyces sp. NPDC047461 TaxID=3155619 RepID=UPI0034081AA4